MWQSLPIIWISSDERRHIKAIRRNPTKLGEGEGHRLTGRDRYWNKGLELFGLIPVP